MNFWQKITPRVPKRILFFLAALVWTFAGSMLLIKGFGWFYYVRDFRIIKLIASITAGLIFYYLMFKKLSGKHSRRIFELKTSHPCVFSFFNIRSYGIMTIMISLGIILRTSGIIPLDYLSLFYITMGIPLLLSSIRFYISGFLFPKI